MTPVDTRPLVALAERLADAAGGVIRRYFRAPVAVDSKADSSPVTIADREAERAMRAILAAERPGDGIHGEEFGRERGDAPFVWVLDPIDGTKAFISGRPLFGTLVGLLHHGTPILGVIDQPVTGDRWIGAAGQPTTLNGAPVRTRACPRLDDALISTTGPDLFAPDELARFERLRRRTRISTWGGDCYAYGLVAAGFVDLVVEAGLKLHDFAALVPIVEGAGGRMTDWTGRPLDARSDGSVVAAGDPAVLPAVLAALQGGDDAPTR